jgi:hypothetical protein
MDSQNLRIDPLPLEKEFSVLSVRKRLSELSREELEEFLSQALLLLAKLSHQTQQMKDFIAEIGG